MKCNKIIVILLICIFLIIFSICAYFLLKDMKDLKENNDKVENLIEESTIINEETEEKRIDWNYLKSINSDIIAWIEIEGTNINYPILKDEDVYYLKHSFDKRYNSNGSIFTTNSKPFEDLETVVYGHNMKNGSMFSNLGSYLNKEFLYAHQKFKIYTPDGNYEAIVFSAYTIGIETESNNIKSLKFEERVQYYKKASKYNLEIVDNINKIVKLSTCSYINANTTPTDQRYYIIASLNQI
jgi:sortase B